MLTNKQRLAVYKAILERASLSEGPRLANRWEGICACFLEGVRDLYSPKEFDYTYEVINIGDSNYLMPEIWKQRTKRDCKQSEFWFNNREERIIALESAVVLMEALEWWKGIGDAAERVEWKTRMAMRFYGFEASYTTLTDQQIVRIYKLLRTDDGKIDQSI